MSNHDRNYIGSLEALGFTLARSSKNHWKIYDGPVLVTTHGGSPSDYRGVKNLKAAIRRYQRAKEIGMAPRPPRPKRKCGACKGKGTVTKWTVDRKGKRISYEATCDNCGGQGET